MHPQVQKDGETRLTPCSPGDPGAKEMTWEDVEGDKLLEPPVDFKDFVKAIKTSGTSVSTVDLEKNAEWTTQFGSEGN
jgi:vacuolar protein-sorting-associated protein 4